jgi:GNAT superfamily N-acetyltransferase
MSNEVSIRTATSDDVHELARLNAIFNGVHEAPEQMAARLADPHRVETPIIAEMGGRLVGFAGLRLVPCVFYAAPHAELTELFVEEGYRRRGIGRGLVAYAERLAHAGGAKEMLVLTGLTNREGQALYRAMGYEEDDLAMYKGLAGP